MNREEAQKAANALDFLDTYHYPKIKEAVQELREIFTPIIDKSLKDTKDISRAIGMKQSYETRQIEAMVGHVIRVFSNLPKIYEEASTNQEKTFRRTQDILHAIELLDLTEEEMIELAKELHDIRIVRREAKDFTDVALPLYDLVCKYPHLATEFSKVHSEIVKLIKQKENRKYTPREKTELTEKFEKLG